MEKVKPMGMDRGMASKKHVKSLSRTVHGSNTGWRHPVFAMPRPSLAKLHPHFTRVEIDRSLNSLIINFQKTIQISSKYETGSEREVRDWIQALTGENVGSGAIEVEKNLRNGQVLCRLMQKVLELTPPQTLPEACRGLTIKPNTSQMPFKQMENIEVFLKGTQKYGVQKSSCFNTADLFDGRNMAMVVSTLLLLGSETQRHKMQGPVCGPKPSEKNIRNFTDEQLRAGQGMIGLQAGTNKCASQAGMKMGASRHIADIKTDDMSREGQGIIGLQAGSNKGASQSGMSMGAVRHIADIRADDMSAEGQGIIGLQAGSNKGASQSGMSMGAVRHIADIRADDMSAAGQGIIGLQAGSNKGASQTGMSMGAVRHIADIRADQMDAAGQSIIGLQAGSNKGASQAGMSMGAVRHIADIRADQMDAAGQSIIGLQAGSNKGASQAGMSMGAVRHIADIRADQYVGQDVSLQYGSNKGASQAGMNIGKGRHITD